MSGVAIIFSIRGLQKSIAADWQSLGWIVACAYATLGLAKRPNRSEHRAGELPSSSPIAYHCVAGLPSVFYLLSPGLADLGPERAGIPAASWAACYPSCPGPN